ncbi:MAG: phosphoribosylaminoimidazolesuccinocarboxamide synthase [Deltaproteobacteria bacterium]|nr:phosphoribosylaminoimidazolesuccinocarboxamide synthase [Deltaproteobacteria bacterium]
MSPARSQVTHDMLRAALSTTLETTSFEGLGERYEGKVRDNYSTSDGRRTIVVTDRISAFDRVIGTLPFKGQVLNRIACWWFDQSKAVAPNHMLRLVDPAVIEVVECQPLAVEMIVRAYLTGVTSTSVWTHYKQGARVFCGHKLPDGLRENEKLPKPILTPSTKAAKGGHDVSASREEILAMGQITAADFDAAAEMSMALFAFGQKLCHERGLILVDTKYEFGRTPDGRIVVIDEIHTPDSSRFWFEGTYGERMARGERPDSFDKEYVRRWLSAQGFSGDGPIPVIPDDVRIEAASRYIETYETITGEPFVPDTSSPIERIRRNLRL